MRVAAALPTVAILAGIAGSISPALAQGPVGATHVDVPGLK
jgi:hypothetical protein